MRQLAGTRTKYRRADATPLAGLISNRSNYNRYWLIVKSPIPRTSNRISYFLDKMRIDAAVSAELAI